MLSRWRKNLIWILLVVMFLFSTAIVSVPVSTSNPETVLSVVDETLSPVIIDKTKTPGSTFTIYVIVEDVELMWGYQFSVRYDTGVLTATSYAGVWPFESEHPGWIDDGAGYVLMSFSLPPGSEGFNTLDPWPVAQVDFTVDELGGSPLDIGGTPGMKGTEYEFSVLSDIYGDPIPHDVVGGFFANEIHDIAVTDVTPSATAVTKPDPVYIDVTVLNEGEHSETFNVTAYYDDNLIEMKTDITLAAGADTTLTFTWDTTFVSAGAYTISANATVLPAEPPAERADNASTDGTVTVIAPTEAGFNYAPTLPLESQDITFNASSSTPSSGATFIRYAWDFNDSTTVVYAGANLTEIATHNYTTAGTYYVILNVTDSNGYSDAVMKPVTVYRRDVAIVSITSDETEVDAGTAVSIDVTVVNEGDFTETFTLTAYYDDEPIGTQTVSDLAKGASKTLSFLWGTTNLNGTFEIRAVASTVPGEIDTADNVLTDGEVTIHLVRDIAVFDVTVSPTNATPGENITITVGVYNYGYVNETFDVSVYYDGILIDTLTVTDLERDVSRWLDFTWNTTSVAEGTYTIKAVADTLPGEAIIVDNEKEADDEVFLGHHDIAVVDVIVPKTRVEVGESIFINVTVVNQGDFTETFNVTVRYDDTVIGTANVTELGAGMNKTLMFTWDTTGVTGTYTIKAVASTAIIETETDDNTLTGDTVTVKFTSVITISANPSTLSVGETTTISGAITPTRAGVAVTISYRLTGEDTWNDLTTQTDENGHYSYDWTPTTAGEYEVKANWAGDATTFEDESDPETVTVKETSDFTLYMVGGVVVAIVLVILVYMLKVRKPKPT